MYLKAFSSAAGDDLLIWVMEQGLAISGAPCSAAVMQSRMSHRLTAHAHV